MIEAANKQANAMTTGGISQSGYQRTRIARNQAVLCTRAWPASSSASARPFLAVSVNNSHKQKNPQELKASGLKASTEVVDAL